MQAAKICFAHKVAIQPHVSPVWRNSTWG